MFTAMLVKNSLQNSPHFSRTTLRNLCIDYTLLASGSRRKFYVRDKIFTNIDELPFRPYALVLGTSKYTVSGKPNVYYDSRLMAAKT